MKQILKPLLGLLVLVIGGMAVYVTATSSLRQYKAYNDHKTRVAYVAPPAASPPAVRSLKPQASNSLKSRGTVAKKPKPLPPPKPAPKPLTYTEYLWQTFNMERGLNWTSNVVTIVTGVLLILRRRKDQ